MLRSILTSSKRLPGTYVIPRSIRMPQIAQMGSRVGVRCYSDVSMDEYESKIYDILAKEFSPKALEVKDVSGGCGSMFAILVESDKFKGVPMIKQHRLVNEVLKDEIAKWHGLQLRTKST